MGILGKIAPRAFRRTPTGKIHLPDCYYAECNYETVMYTAAELRALPFYDALCGHCLWTYPAMRCEWVWNES